MALSKDWPCGSAKRKLGSDSEGRLVMRLQIVRGSFLTAEGNSPMDEAVWSKMPEDIMWAVLRFVPVAKLFQLQLVSRKWRQVLTSADFRERIAAGPRGSDSQEQPRVVACVTEDCGDSSVRETKVVDIDLSFVPKSFSRRVNGGRQYPYSIKAAANGLVRISNDSKPMKSQFKSKAGQFCVLNPLTRTCIVLPRFPGELLMLPPTTTATALNREWGDYEVLTCDLATGRGWVLAASTSGLPEEEKHLGLLPTHALVQADSGEIYWCQRGGRVQVLAPGSYDPEKEMDPAAALDAPSVATLGLDADSIGIHDRHLFLVANRGAVFFVARLVKKDDTTTDHFGVACGVWRLAHDSTVLVWQAVSRLDVVDLTRLTGLDCERGNLHLRGVYGVGELVCCQVQVSKYRSGMMEDVSDKVSNVCFLLGVNTDTGDWEMVCAHPRAYYWYEDSLALGLPTAPKVLELRPDLFLS